LYLVHLVLLATVFHLFYGKVNSYILAGVVVVGSLILAQIFYWLIEEPSIRLGRWLTAKKKVVVPVIAA
jgi:peptidoglycan/LPS O-acetylase OafA/YrhL